MNRFIKLNQLVVLAAVAAAGACSPKVDAGGYIREGDMKSQIAVGQTTKDEVQAKFGSPSSQSTFGNETWYYITTRKETTAFLAPETVQQDVTRIEFGPSGVVSSVESFDRASGKDFDTVDRATPTEGHTLGFFEQIVGNIGRFNRPAGSGSVVPGRQPGGNY